MRGADQDERAAFDFDEADFFGVIVRRFQASLRVDRIRRNGRILAAAVQRRVPSAAPSMVEARRAWVPQWSKGSLAASPCDLAKKKMRGSFSAFRWEKESKLSDEEQVGLRDLAVDRNNLYREESYTDLKVATSLSYC